MTDKIQESTDDNASMNHAPTMSAISRADWLHFLTAQLDDAWSRTYSEISFISETEYLAGIMLPLGLMKEP